MWVFSGDVSYSHITRRVDKLVLDKTALDVMLEHGLLDGSSNSRAPLIEHDP